MTDTNHAASPNARHLVVLVTRGPETEEASVAMTIARGGITSGLKVTLFLTAAGVDVVRKGAAAHAHFSPLDPLQAQIEDLLSRGARLFACTPCVKARGYEEKDLVKGVVISGASVIHELFLQGAASLSF